MGLLPRLVEVPLVGIGLFVALWGSRFRGWENASVIAAVMFSFAVGVPPTILLGLVLRPGAVLLGGVWCLSVLAVLSGRFPRIPSLFTDEPPPAPVPSGSTRWSVTRHSTVVAITAVTGLLIADVLEFPRDYWVMLTVIVALRLDLAATLAYTVARTVGTILGAAAALAVTTLTSGPWILCVVLFLTTLMAFATRSVNYALYSAGITLTVIVLLNLVYSGGPFLAVARVIDTVIGGSLALVAAAALSGRVHRPSRSSAPVK